MKKSVKMRIVAVVLLLAMMVSVWNAPAVLADNMEDNAFVDSNLGNTVPGDMDGNHIVDNKDVEYLLWHTLFPVDYPLPVSGDFDQNDSVDNKDVEYLLWHTLFPTDYPLNTHTHSFSD